jgi:hypothetical protein
MAEALESLYPGVKFGIDLQSKQDFTMTLTLAIKPSD